MRSVLEFFQTFGALVGFAVGCITVYDRLLRYRPHVSIYAYLEGVNPWPMLRVTNTAPFDIGIDPPLITVTQQTTVRAIADTLIGARVTATIAPEKSADFHIIGRGTDNEGREADRIKITVRWHRSKPGLISRPPATIITSINDLEDRKQAAARGRKA